MIFIQVLSCGIAERIIQQMIGAGVKTSIKQDELTANFSQGECRFPSWHGVVRVNASVPVDVGLSLAIAPIISGNLPGKYDFIENLFYFNLRLLLKRRM